MTLTGSFNLVGATCPTACGCWRTWSPRVTCPSTGIIAYGQQGANMVTGVLGPKVPSQAILRYSDGTIQPVPEPSTLVLAGLALVGLAFACKRRK